MDHCLLSVDYGPSFISIEDFERTSANRERISLGSATLKLPTFDGHLNQSNTG